MWLRSILRWNLPESRRHWHFDSTLFRLGSTKVVGGRSIGTNEANLVPTATVCLVLLSNSSKKGCTSHIS